LLPRHSRSFQHNIKTEEDAALQSKVETLAGENIKLLDDINRLQNAIPFISGNDLSLKLEFS
jgi:hypothetical protein